MSVTIRSIFIKFPPSLQRGIFTHALTLRKIIFFGNRFYCPVCESRVRKFYGVGSRLNAWCSVCNAAERHRLVWLFLQRKTNIFEQVPKRVLHIGPRLILELKFRQMANLDYLTADLSNSRAMVKMDITDIQYPDHSFDIIFCNHVLEHISDDRQAMRELYRVLKPKGWAILLVPITAEATFEDPSVTDPAEREKLFGQYDHVRRYGPDYIDRLKDSGFHVSVFSAAEFLDLNDLSRMGLCPDETIFYCEK